MARLIFSKLFESIFTFNKAAEFRNVALLNLVTYEIENTEIA